MKSRGRALSAIPAASRPKKSYQKATNITFFNFSAPGGPSGNSCIVGLGDNGQVFVPAAVFPDKGQSALPKAVAQGVAGGAHEGNAYLPADWVRNELSGLPDRIQIVDNMVKAIRSMKY